MIYHSTQSIGYLWYLILRGKYKKKQEKQGELVNVKVAQNVPTTVLEIYKFRFFFKLVALFFPNGVIKNLNKKKAYLTVIVKKTFGKQFLTQKSTKKITRMTKNIVKKLFKKIFISFC